MKTSILEMINRIRRLLDMNWHKDSLLAKSINSGNVSCLCNPVFLNLFRITTRHTKNIRKLSQHPATPNNYKLQNNFKVKEDYFFSKSRDTG